MAKGVNPVERLRPTNGNLQPTIRISDNYTPPVGVPLSRVGTEYGELANFLQQASGKAEKLYKQEVATKSYLEQVKALELDYANPDGSYKTIDQLKESGELSFITPEVTMKMNEALGTQIGQDMQGKMHDWKEANMESLAAMSSDQFLDAFDGHITHLTQQPGVIDATLQPGVTKKIKDQLSGLRSRFLSEQAAAAKEYTDGKLRDALRNNIDAALNGIDDPTKAGEALSTYLQSEGASGLYKGSYTRLNNEAMAYVAWNIENATTSVEVDRWLNIIENTQAGSGSISNTRAWKDGSRKIIADAESRLATLQNKEHTQKVRLEAENLDAFGEAYLEHRNNGGTRNDFTYDGEMTASEVDKLARLNSIDSAYNTAEFPPISTDRWEAIFSRFEGNDEATNLKIRQDMISGLDPMIGDVSRAELQAIPNIMSIATSKPNAERSQVTYKDGIKALQRDYDVVDFITGSAKANLSTRAKEVYAQAERKYRELYYQFASNPGEQIPEVFNSDQAQVDILMAMPPNQRMIHILSHPKLSSKLVDYLVDETENYYPTSLGMAGNKDQTGGSVFTDDTTGEVTVDVNGVPMTVTRKVGTVKVPPKQ